MIPVDTSVIVAWLDPAHEAHVRCEQALLRWAGRAFGRHHPAKGDNKPGLPDFLIRAQAATLGCRHLTNDRRRLRSVLEVEFLFP